MLLGCGVSDVDFDALAATETDVGGDEGVCVREFYMHFSVMVGILAGRRANLMAVEKGRRNTVTHGGLLCSFQTPDYHSVSGTNAHRTPE